MGCERHIICKVLLALGSLALAPACFAEEAASSSAPAAFQIGVNAPKTESVTAGVFRGLVYCLAVGLLGHAVVRKLKSRGIVKSDARQVMEVSARLAVAPRQSLLVVNVDGERFLIAQSAEALSLVARLGEQSVKAEETSGSVVELAKRPPISLSVATTGAVARG